MPESTQSAQQAHACHWPNCAVQVPPALFMCRLHWTRLPAPLRMAVWRTYRPGQERDKRPTRSYLDAADAALRWAARCGTVGSLLIAALLATMAQAAQVVPVDEASVRALALYVTAMDPSGPCADEEMRRAAAGRGYANLREKIIRANAECAKRKDSDSRYYDYSRRCSLTPDGKYLVVP